MQVADSLVTIKVALPLYTVLGKQNYELPLSMQYIIQRLANIKVYM